MAAAASILLIVSLLAWRPSDEAGTETVAHDDPAQPAAASERRTVVSRDPNAYERVVLSHLMPKRKQLSRTAQQALVEELIAALASDADADIEERLSSLPSNPARCEAQLASAVRQGPPERRLGAARLLSRTGTRRSVPVLVELTADPAARDAAVVGLGRLVADRDLAQLASQTRDLELRGRLLRALLERRTPESVALYLEFVNGTATQAKALEVVAQIENPPADQLLVYLDNPQNSLRLAAALALSRLSDPTVVERLCASVWGIGRREVLIALLLSRSKEAAGCVQHARENLYLVASLQAAEQQLDSLHIPRGGYLP
jgi:hypothetical protein